MAADAGGTGEIDVGVPTVYGIHIRPYRVRKPRRPGNVTTWVSSSVFGSNELPWPRGQDECEIYVAFEQTLSSTVCRQGRLHACGSRTKRDTFLTLCFRG